MTVLVTGGAGFIGSHMVLDLLDAGEEVVVLDRLSSGFAWAVPDGAELVVGDIGDRALLDSLLARRRFDAILHFAGSIVVSESVADPLSYYDNNVLRSQTLIEAAVAAGVPNFVFSSSAAVYGSSGHLPVSEEAPTQPKSPYGRTKLMVEWMLRDVADATGLRYAALRYFNVSGADPAGRTGQSTRGATHLIKIACEAALGKRPQVEIFGRDYPTADGTCVRDYIHVSDLVAAHRLALEHLAGGGESLAVNCGYGRGFSVLEVLGAVERVTGRKLPLADAPRRPGDPASIVADPRRAHEVLGWRPQRVQIDELVRDALAWEARLSEKELASRVGGEAWLSQSARGLRSKAAANP